MSQAHLAGFFLACLVLGTFQFVKRLDLHVFRLLGLGEGGVENDFLSPQVHHRWLPQRQERAEKGGEKKEMEQMRGASRPRTRQPSGSGGCLRHPRHRPASQPQVGGAPNAPWDCHDIIGSRLTGVSFFFFFSLSHCLPLWLSRLLFCSWANARVNITVMSFPYISTFWES